MAEEAAGEARFRLDEGARRRFDPRMRLRVLLFALAVGFAGVIMGCERSQPAASPSSCGCAVKRSGERPAPMREEPADIVR
ncbi:MAG TPA: hypothetical protein VE093_08220 [Polyangiaceae bacterium]|jgi:hypothetical protein|nr:hypothetical protein [Polyangiaceae bacterium]